MSELEKLKHDLSKQDEFIGNLVEELKDVYNLVDCLKKEAIRITDDFKYLLDAFDRNKQP